VPLRGKTRRDVLSEFRRAEILEAARNVCASRGFNDVSVDEIAHEAGIAKGTLYLYFRSKDEIYWAMLEQVYTTLHGEVAAGLSSGATLEQRIRAFVDTKMRRFEAHRDLFRLYLSESSHITGRGVRVGERYERLYLDQVKRLEATLREGIARGEIRLDRADAAAFAVFDLTRAAIVQRLRGWSRATLEQDIDFTFRLIWKGISG
jgi:AcrR family transcriptional regulator